MDGVNVNLRFLSKPGTILILAKLQEILRSCTFHNGDPSYLSTLCAGERRSGAAKLRPSSQPNIPCLWPLLVYD